MSGERPKVVIFVDDDVFILRAMKRGLTALLEDGGGGGKLP
jgi:hypothetical protein